MPAGQADARSRPDASSIAGGLAGMSNVFGDAAEAIGAAAKTFSDADLAGYESGGGLSVALARRIDRPCTALP